MRTSVALQLLGPVSLFGVMAIAEVAAFALNSAPASEWLWYLNLKWFALFQQSHYASEAILGDGAQNLVVGLPLLSRGRFQADLVVGHVKQSHARLRRVRSPNLGPGKGAAPGLAVILLATLLSLCLLSFAFSHVIYLQKTITHIA